MVGTRLGMAALCAVAIAGCGSSSGEPSGSTSLPANPGGGPAAAQQDPCKLFAADQLNAAFGQHFGAGRKERGALQPTCDWTDPAAGVGAVVAVKKADEPDFDSDLKGAGSDEYERSSPVVGDDSVWFDPKATDTVSLIVISNGYRYQVSIAVGQTGTDQRRTQLMTLVRAVF